MAERGDGRPMRFRFSLYGFLKNQRYYEPFIILFILSLAREQSADNRFLLLGTVLAFREVCINLMEIPSGAVADVWGRRRAMVACMAAYIAAFAVFGLAGSYWHLYPAMLLFAVGEALRTGTHKAMILDWLQRRGRLDERTEFYGYTRSWSKIGSAVSIIPATLLLFLTGEYRWAFWACIPLCAVNLVNLYMYPRYLDSPGAEEPSIRRTFVLLGRSLKQAFLRPRLRTLVFESMLCEGMFKPIKDYIQPIVAGAAVLLALPVAASLAQSGDPLVERQRVAMLMGPVFFVIYAFESWASRKSHRLVARTGGEEQAAHLLWVLILWLYAALTTVLIVHAYALRDHVEMMELAALAAAIVAYFGLFFLMNLWQPNQVSRFNSESEAEATATVLSIQSQAKTLSAMLAAPFLGWAVDHVGGGFWPVAMFGAAAGFFGLTIHSRRAMLARLRARRRQP